MAPQCDEHEYNPSNKKQLTPGIKACKVYHFTTAASCPRKGVAVNSCPTLLHMGVLARHYARTASPRNRFDAPRTTVLCCPLRRCYVDPRHGIMERERLPLTPVARAFADATPLQVHSNERCIG